MSDETRVLDTRRKTDSVNVRVGNDYLVEIYGKDMGKKFCLNKDEILLGRAFDADIQINSDIVSRKHALIKREDDHWLLVDLDSTNGTWVDGYPVKKAVLRGGEQIKIGDTIFKFLSGDKVETLYFETIYQIMIYDGLTNVFNRRYVYEMLDREFSRAKRYKRNLSVMFIDLDNLKEINDTYGHLAGDHVLREVATTIKNSIRHEEVVGRYGGDEFIVVIPEANVENLKKFAKRIKKKIENKKIYFEDNKITTTVSIGIGQIDENMKHFEELIKKADENLYKAKKQGKNRIVI